jgi:hypothetical protein
LDEGVDEPKVVFRKIMERHGGRLVGSRSILFGGVVVAVAVKKGGD